MVALEEEEPEIPNIDPDPSTWVFDILGSYDAFSRFKVPKWIAGYADTQTRYDQIGYYDNISRMKPDMSRFRDPANEPQEPENEYTEDNPPMIFTDPDTDSVPAPAPPSLVPKVKMTPPREFKSGQDAEVWLDTVDKYFQFTYPGVKDKDLITVFLTLIQNNDRHYFQVLAQQPSATYEMVRQTFLRQFGNPHKRSVAKKHLMALSQGTQTFADYLRTFTSLASLAAVDLNDVLIKDRFVTSMDPDLRRQFQLRFLTEEQRNNLSWQETTQILLDLNYVIHSKQSETLHYRGQKEQLSGGPAKKDKGKGRGQKPYDRSNRNRNQNQSGSQNSNQNRNKGKGGKGKGNGKGRSQNPQSCNRCGRVGHIEKDCYSTKTPDGKEIKGKPPAQSPFQNRRQQQQNQGAKDGSGKLINTINTLVKELKNQHSINAAVATPVPASAPAPQGNSQGTAQEEEEEGEEDSFSSEEEEEIFIVEKLGPIKWLNGGWVTHRKGSLRLIQAAWIIGADNRNKCLDWFSGACHEILLPRPLNQCCFHAFQVL
ncbi:hypothetical protein CYMTET_47502 [Cymbomonas tetramitiformis]|uniref:CCHC-type domain-containing protein n=1 Tax=Cymbomonas tetramitiformis TaxID=36881 RepID=A0AAE0BU45_9CHLO|nr:hypothetical protein CYMTET_47502 [Cymbomonas tetramitiformis]